MPDLYIIAGCNGAGKTTASETILPELLNCREFVNADNIARGLSPFNVEAVAFEAGRIMLHRIYELLEDGVDFAIETTLSTRSYVSMVNDAHDRGYKVTLIYVWLENEELAIDRVAKRVSKGGHHIPSDIIKRRYQRGIRNLVHLFIPIVDYWIVTNNSNASLEEIASGEKLLAQTITMEYLWEQILQLAYDTKRNHQ